MGDGCLCDSAPRVTAVCVPIDAVHHFAWAESESAGVTYGKRPAHCRTCMALKISESIRTSIPARPACESASGLHGRTRHGTHAERTKRFGNEADLLWSFLGPKPTIRATHATVS